MPPLLLVILQFTVCTALILWTGVRLSAYGSVIAEKTGLGGTWVGLLLLATVTSLPELITGTSAVAFFEVPDIAVGDVVGSCMFNLVILALLDVRQPSPLSARIHQGHTLSAAFGILQLALAALAIVAGDRAPVLGWFGLHSVVFIGLYALAVRTIFSFERARLKAIAQELAEEKRYDDISLSRAITRYVATATVLVAAAAYLPALGERLADLTGLTQSFVGSVFVAASTSFPEVVVSMAAVRSGALDMAAANLFGSNLFNLAVLGLDDLVSVRGPLLASGATEHLTSIAGAIMMTAVAIVGVTYRARRKHYRISWDSLAIVIIYGMVLLALR